MAKVIIFVFLMAIAVAVLSAPTEGTVLYCFHSPTTIYVRYALETF